MVMGKMSFKAEEMDQDELQGILDKVEDVNEDEIDDEMEQITNPAEDHNMEDQEKQVEDTVLEQNMSLTDDTVAALSWGRAPELRKTYNLSTGVDCINMLEDLAAHPVECATDVAKDEFNSQIGITQCMRHQFRKVFLFSKHTVSGR